MNSLLKSKYCSIFTKQYISYVLKRQRLSLFKSTFVVQDATERCKKKYEYPLSYPFTFCQIREYAKKAQGKMPKGGKYKAQQLSDEEMADVIDIADYHEQLDNIVEKLKKDFVENLSIRSAAGNLDKILVKVDDEEYPLNELAVISKKNPNLVAINMIDFPEGLKPAMQAILQSGAGLNPQQEGTMIYVSIPKLTREHRENLSKSAKSLFIKAKDEVRAVQNSFMKEAKGKTELSEDLVFSTTNQIKTIAEQCAADLEKTMKTKQKELLGDSSA